ncbi:MAG: FAD-linked oxidase C-terminal domain-containing protein [Clostridia bacterium]|jgi:glycolate oxidase|nr:FAD-linked oxidase C-terminal domain-containing protein [Clostridia bacterium]
MDLKISPSVKEEITQIVGAENVLTEQEDLMCYAFDAAPGLSKHMPEIVVCAQSKEQISKLVQLAAAHKIPLYTRGGGTNLTGGALPVANGIVLSLLKMNKILEVDAENLTATVEPGVVIYELLEVLEPYGLMYPPDPGTVNTATMGGSAAENSGGLRGLKYGVTKNYVIGLEAVFADGSIARFGGKTVKNVSGYDMVSLLVGSEGTLGIITELTVKLIPIPEYRRSMLAVFDDLDKAAQAIHDIIAHKVIPATLEIMDKFTIRTVENYAKVGLPLEAEAVLLIELDGIKEAAEKEAGIVEEILKENMATEIRVAKDDAERDAIWAARRAALPALVRIKPTTILEDATVPRSKVPEMILALKEIAAKYDLTIGTFGHAGDGNLHPTILTDEADKAEMAKVEHAVDEIFQAALELGGTLSGEHGIGLAKARYLEWEFGEAGVAILHKIKTALDPDGILNPGKMTAV